MLKWLAGKLSIQLYLWTAGVMLAVILSQALLLWWQGRTVTKLNLDVATLTVERDGLKAANARLTKANGDWVRTFTSVKAKLDKANAENARIDDESKTAVAQAEAEALDAERTLKAFMDKFASRTPSCEQALITMEVACASLSR